MSNTSPIIFSVEKGFRFFQEGISFFHFFMIQFEVEKSLIGNKSYYFSLKNEQNKEIYSKEIFMDLQNHRIVTPKSHEDPLIEDEKSYFICFQVDSEMLATFNEPSQALFYEIQDDGILNLISTANVGILADIYNRYKTEHYSQIINGNQLVSNKDCPLTLHLGDSKGQYSEQYFQIKKDEIFDFSQYIQDYEYIGVQCSYENEIPEIEEKHIIVGQKGIYLSGYFYDGSIKLMPPLPFMEKYQKEYNANEFKKIHSIDELINYYKTNALTPKHFESNLQFLLPTYLKESTYNQDKLYSDKPPQKKHHFLSDICQNCSQNSKCVQVVPSGLSTELFKKNITLEDNRDCELFEILRKS